MDMDWTEVPPHERPAVLRRIRALEAVLAGVRREDYASEKEWRAARVAATLDHFGALGQPKR